MQIHSLHDSLGHAIRRPSSARRALTLAPLVPSQDVSRYPARDMPPPTYDLDRREPSALFRLILVPALVIAATGCAIMLIDRIGTWLAP